MHRLAFFLVLVTAFASAANAVGPSAQSEAWPGGDPMVKPGTDFFLFANGGWLNENPIPADRVGFSNATLLTVSAMAKVRTLLEEAAANATADNAHFAAKAEELVTLFSGCEAAPGVHVDGHLTLGENIADIGGLQLAFAAYHASLHGNPARVINGLSGDQRFFLGFAKLRRGHRRPQALRNDVASDPHTR